MKRTPIPTAGHQRDSGPGNGTPRAFATPKVTAAASTYRIPA